MQIQNKGNIENIGDTVPTAAKDYLKFTYLPSLEKAFNKEIHKLNLNARVTKAKMSNTSEAMYVTVKLIDRSMDYSISIRNHFYNQPNEIIMTYYLAKYHDLDDLTINIIKNFDKFVEELEAVTSYVKLTDKTAVPTNISIKNFDENILSPEDQDDINRTTQMINIIKEIQSKGEKSTLLKIKNIDRVVNNLNTFFLMFPVHSADKALSETLYLLNTSFNVNDESEHITWRAHPYVYSGNSRVNVKYRYQLYIEGFLNNSGLILIDFMNDQVFLENVMTLNK